MRTPLIAGNWKMHKTPSEADTWLRAFLEDLSTVDTSHAEILFHVPATHVRSLATIADGTSVRIGAQDVSAHAQGAYTGEISAAMLRDAGATHVIVGHSERRAYHHEDDALVGAKVRAAMAGDVVPVLCVGEREEERERDEHERVVVRQLSEALDGVDLQRSDALVVAYEPVWAIGTGRTATAADAQAMGAVTRSFLKGRFGPLADGVRILYGGSMKASNAAELLAKADVDGGLIGGASLERGQLVAIVEAARA
ncbi:triose-phosphate isomerase [soil metagenome]